MSALNLYRITIDVVVIANSDSAAEILLRKKIQQRNLGAEYSDIFEFKKINSQKDIPKKFYDRPPISDSNLRTSCKILADKLRPEPESIDMFEGVEAG
jgi:hypothetical protein